MWNNTRLTQLIGLKYPIIQAPMAGGATSPALVVSVCNAGGLGSLGAGYLSADQIREAIKTIRKGTKNPFAVNLFIPEPASATHEQMQKSCAAINQCAAALNPHIEPKKGPYASNFDEQVNILLEEKIPVFSFTFGMLSPDLIKLFKLNIEIK